MIGVAARRDQPGGRVILRHVEAGGGRRPIGAFRQIARRGGGGEHRLAHALRPREQPGMVHPALRHGIPESGDLIAMAKRRHNPSSAASSRAVTSSAVPVASTMRKRAGSPAASAAKAAATRA
ncbi:hypothetical protein BHE75_02248 [Sphingomonas haloaromaticamans]|uniref:Uncharacterized protein n=1 Tax=Edaphosphingomonas haloaromaticamans TaxID=653954 RepID=A0A1S1HEL2_9SPHN|nr:hypothetical protein BHE75_02248 [Sphingomonas haloaromaticamans]